MENNMTDKKPTTQINVDLKNLELKDAFLAKVKKADTNASRVLREFVKGYVNEA